MVFDKLKKLLGLSNDTGPQRKNPTQYALSAETEQIVMRSWCFALRCNQKIHDEFPPVLRNQMPIEVIWETLGYAVGTAFDRISKDIEDAFDWDSQGYELNLGYQTDIAAAFADLEDRSDERVQFYMELFESYYNIDYSDEYEEFYGIGEDECFESSLKYKFTRERFYAFRINRYVKVRNLDQVVKNAAELYAPMGTNSYLDAFRAMSLDEVRRDITPLLQAMKARGDKGK
jgi:hypothetical protein